MSKSVIQPLSCPDLSPSEHSLALMEKKLAMAEDETRHLLEEMGQTVGKGRPSFQDVSMHGPTDFSPLKYEEILESKCNVRPGQKDKDLHAKITKHFSQNVKGQMTPSFNARGDTCSLQATLPRNYDRLVSRMCRNESAIQTLKLNLLNLKGNYDLKKRQQAESEEKLVALTEKYEDDTGRLEREVSKVKQDLKLEVESKCSLETQLKTLTEQAEANSKAKVEADAAVMGFGDTKDKLSRKIQSLTEDLAREVSLRERLENSHETLLARIRETEMMVETERTQMGSLNSASESLKAQIVRLQEELRAESETRQLAAKKCGLLETELSDKRAEIGSRETEKEKLRREIDKLRSQYEGLISQLQSMESIMSQHQEVHSELQAKNQRLKEALDEADLERESLIQRHKTDIEMERAKGADCARLEEKNRSLQATVKQLESENEQLVQNRDRLENEALESTSLLKSREREFQQSVAALEAELNNLRAQLSHMEKDKLRANKDKEDLLHEVNSAVDGMSDERWRLRNELQDAKLEIKALTKTSQDLESECATLQERNRALLSQESSRKQLDSTLKETADHKNRLAYDKGRLQSQVTKLQAEVNSLANTQIQLVHLQKHCDGVEAKYCKAQKEVGDYKLRVQRLENQVKQASDSAGRQEADFNLAIRSRDEAVKENCQLLERLNALEEQDTQKVISLERSLEEIRQDNFKLTQTLSTVMSAHTQLQTAVENLQTDLGQRDAHIAQLTADKSQAKQKVRDLQSEAELLKQRVISLETLESNELEPLRKALQRCRDDNGKMAASLEDVLDCNSELQASVDRLQADVQKKDSLITKLKDAREKEQKRVEKELRSYEERISNIGDQLRQERDKTAKKSNKDVSEMRKQNEGMISKNGDLSRTNTELRQKVSELETTVKELKQKLTNQKAQIEHMARAKKQMEEHFQHLKDVRGKLDDLEKVRDEYIEKNRQQGKSISALLSQLGSLQTELRHLAQDQFTTRELVQRKDEELVRERKLREEMARKYMDSRKSREEIEKQKLEFEEKIRLANEESLEVSKNLEAAHDWFKTKFDSLQEELATSKQAQAELEQDNISQRVKLEEERRRAKETAERARHMIRSSRKTMSQLGDYTSLLEQNPTDQVASLHQQIEKEKLQKKKMGTKSKNSNSKQLEALINKYTKK